MSEIEKNSQDQSQDFNFPKWVNVMPTVLAAGLFATVLFVIFVFWYWFSPKNLDVGYQPKQPIPFSHQLHAGELGMDCRYCHFTVERANHAAIPTSETCMNCHDVIKKDSPHIAKIKESYHSNTPIEWVKVHDLGDYAYFSHSRHVNAGVSCVSCHGRIDKMKEVYQVEPLSMGWCLDCHRNPDPNIRPVEFVTKLDWSTEDPVALGRKLRKERNIQPREDCSTCHR